MINQCVCQYHKVHEKAMVIPCKGYKIEGRNRYGTSEEDYPEASSVVYQDYNRATVEHMDHDASWYRNHFLGKDYVTFVGYTADNDPLLISAVYEEYHGQKQYRLIVRTKQVSVHRLLCRRVTISLKHRVSGTCSSEDCTRLFSVECTFCQCHTKRSDPGHHVESRDRVFSRPTIQSLEENWKRYNGILWSGR